MFVYLIPPLIGRPLAFSVVSSLGNTFRRLYVNLIAESLFYRNLQTVSWNILHMTPPPPVCCSFSPLQQTSGDHGWL